MQFHSAVAREWAASMRSTGEGRQVRLRVPRTRISGRAGELRSPSLRALTAVLKGPSWSQLHLALKGDFLVKSRIPNPPRILVIDVGGSHVKCMSTGRRQPRKFESGPKLRPQGMVEQVKQLTQGWRFDVVSIGYPGVVRAGKIARDPNHLGTGWIGFDFEKAFGCPVKLLNDAAMQALGAYGGGTMLFMGLGTGLGSALIVDGVIAPLELGHLRYSHGKTYEQLVGEKGRKRLGQKDWRRKVRHMVQGFRNA